MDALIDQLAAARPRADRRATRGRSRRGRHGRSGRGRTSAAPSAPASTSARACDERRMIAMIEPDAHEAPVLARRRRDRPSISATVRAGGLLDQHVLAGASTAAVATRASASLVVATMTTSTSGAADDVLPAIGGARAGRRCGQGFARAPALTSAQATSAAPAESGGALLGRSGRSRRCRRRTTHRSPHVKTAIAGHDAPQRVDVGAA